MTERKTTARWEWRDGHWWVGIRAEFSLGKADPALAAEGGRQWVWMTYDDLCDAFPGLQDFLTPA